MTCYHSVVKLANVLPYSIAIRAYAKGMTSVRMSVRPSVTLLVDSDHIA